MRRLIPVIGLLAAGALAAAQAPPVPPQKPPDDAEKALRAAVAQAPPIPLEPSALVVAGVEMGMVSWVSSAPGRPPPAA